MSECHCNGKCGSCEYKSFQGMADKYQADVAEINAIAAEIFDLDQLLACHRAFLDESRQLKTLQKSLAQVTGEYVSIDDSTERRTEKAIAKLQEQRKSLLALLCEGDPDNPICERTSSWKTQRQR